MVSKNPPRFRFTSSFLFLNYEHMLYLLISLLLIMIVMVHLPLYQEDLLSLSFSSFCCPRRHSCCAISSSFLAVPTRLLVDEDEQLQQGPWRCCCKDDSTLERPKLTPSSASLLLLFPFALAAEEPATSANMFPLLQHNKSYVRTLAIVKYSNLRGAFMYNETMLITDSTNARLYSFEFRKTDRIMRFDAIIPSAGRMGRNLYLQEGELFMLRNGASIIYKIKIDLQSLNVFYIHTAFGEEGKEGYDESPNTPILLTRPLDLVLHPTLPYFFYAEKVCVRKLEFTEPRITNAFGQCEVGGTDDGVHPDERFASLSCLFFLNTSSLLLCDLGSLRVVNFAGETLPGKLIFTETVVGFTSASGVPHSFKDGIGKEARFGLITDAVPWNDHTIIFVADAGNLRIRRVQLPEYAVSTLAGSGDTGKQDGIGEYATFQSLNKLLVHDEVLYILDKDSIRAIRLSTAPPTISDSTSTTVSSSLSLMTPSRSATEPIFYLYPGNGTNGSLSSVGLELSSRTSVVVANFTQARVNKLRIMDTYSLVFYAQNASEIIVTDLYMEGPRDSDTICQIWVLASNTTNVTLVGWEVHECTVFILLDEPNNMNKIFEATEANTGNSDDQSTVMTTFVVQDISISTHSRWKQLDNIPVNHIHTDIKIQDSNVFGMRIFVCDLVDSQLYLSSLSIDVEGSEAACGLWIEGSNGYEKTRVSNTIRMMDIVVNATSAMDGSCIVFSSEFDFFNGGFLSLYEVTFACHSGHICRGFLAASVALSSEGKYLISDLTYFGSVSVGDESGQRPLSHGIFLRMLSCSNHSTVKLKRMNLTSTLKRLSTLNISSTTDVVRTWHAFAFLIGNVMIDDRSTFGVQGCEVKVNMENATSSASIPPASIRIAAIECKSIHLSNRSVFRIHDSNFSIGGSFTLMASVAAAVTFRDVLQLQSGSALIITGNHFQNTESAGTTTSSTSVAIRFPNITSFSAGYYTLLHIHRNTVSGCHSFLHFVSLQTFFQDPSLSIGSISFKDGEAEAATISKNEMNTALPAVISIERNSISSNILCDPFDYTSPSSTNSGGLNLSILLVVRCNERKMLEHSLMFETYTQYMLNDLYKYMALSLSSADVLSNNFECSSCDAVKDCVPFSSKTVTWKHIPPHEGKQIGETNSNNNNNNNDCVCGCEYFGGMQGYCAPTHHDEESHMPPSSTDPPVPVQYPSRVVKRLFFTAPTGAVGQANPISCVATERDNVVIVADTQEGALFRVQVDSGQYQKITPRIQDPIPPRWGFITVDPSSSTQGSAYGYLATCPESNEIYQLDNDRRGDKIAIRDAQGSVVELRTPLGIAVSPSKHFFLVSELGGPTIINVSVPLFQLSLVAGTYGSFANVDGAGTDARFLGPAGIAFRSSSEFFVVDRNARTIKRVLIPHFNVTTVAGLFITGYAGGSLDGIGFAARFQDPYDITFLHENVAYVSDASDHLIRRLSFLTSSASSLVEVSTIAGTAGVSSSPFLTNFDGHRSASLLFSPRGLCLSKKRSVLLFAEPFSSGLLRRINISVDFKHTNSPSVSSSLSSSFSPGDCILRNLTSPMYEVAEVGKNRTIGKLEVSHFDDTDPNNMDLIVGVRPVETTGFEIQNLNFQRPIAATTSSSNSYVPGPPNVTLVFPLPFKVLDDYCVLNMVGSTAASSQGLPSSNSTFALVVVIVDRCQLLRYTIEPTNFTSTILSGKPFECGTWDGPATTTARWNRIGAIVQNPTDPNTIFVFDSSFRIRRLDMKREWVSTMAGQTDVSGWEDGTANATLDLIDQMTFATPHLMVFTQRRIKTFRQLSFPELEVTTIAGEPNKQGTIDGIRSQARFSSPLSCACSRDGTSCFVGDNGRIRHVDMLSGCVSSVADGIGETGRFPLVISVDRYPRPDGAIRVFAGEVGTTKIYSGTFLAKGTPSVSISKKTNTPTISSTANESNTATTSTSSSLSVASPSLSHSAATSSLVHVKPAPLTSCSRLNHTSTSLELLDINNPPIISPVPITTGDNNKVKAPPFHPYMRDQEVCHIGTTKRTLLDVNQGRLNVTLSLRFEIRNNMTTKEMKKLLSVQGADLLQILVLRRAAPSPSSAMMTNSIGLLFSVPMESRFLAGTVSFQISTLILRCFDPEFLEISSSSLPLPSPRLFNFTIDVVPVPAPVPAQVRVSMMATGMALSVVSPAGILLQVKMGVISAFKECFFSDTEPLDFFKNILGIRFGVVYGQYYRGGIVSSLICLGVITTILLLLTCIQFVRLTGGYAQSTASALQLPSSRFARTMEALASLRFPGILVLPYSLLGEGIVANSTSLLFHSYANSDYLLALAGFSVTGIVIGYTAFCVFCHRRCKLKVADNTKKKPSLDKKQMVGAVIWTKLCKTSADWVPNSATSKIDDFWLQQHIMIFGDYKFAWFAFFDTISMTILGVIDGLRYNNDTVCTVQASALLALTAVPMLLFIFLRPALNLIGHVFIILVSILTFISCAFVVGSIIRQNDDLVAVSDYFATLVMIVGVLKGLLDVVLLSLWVASIGKKRVLMMAQNLRHSHFFVPSLMMVNRYHNNQRYSSTSPQPDMMDETGQEEEEDENCKEMSQIDLQVLGLDDGVDPLERPILEEAICDGRDEEKGEEMSCLVPVEKEKEDSTEKNVKKVQKKKRKPPAAAPVPANSILIEPTQVTTDDMVAAQEDSGEPSQTATSSAVDRWKEFEHSEKGSRKLSLKRKLVPPPEGYNPMLNTTDGRSNKEKKQGKRIIRKFNPLAKLSPTAAGPSSTSAQDDNTDDEGIISSSSLSDNENCAATTTTKEEEDVEKKPEEEEEETLPVPTGTEANNNNNKNLSEFLDDLDLLAETPRSAELYVEGGRGDDDNKKAKALAIQPPPLTTTTDKEEPVADNDNDLDALLGNTKGAHAHDIDPESPLESFF